MADADSIIAKAQAYADSLQQRAEAFVATLQNVAQPTDLHRAHDARRARVCAAGRAVAHFHRLARHSDRDAADLRLGSPGPEPGTYLEPVRLQRD